MKKLVIICAAILLITDITWAEPFKSYTPVLTGTPIDFEGFAEGTLISNQYPGVVFGQDDGGTPMIDNYGWLYAYGSSSGSAVLTGSTTGGSPYPTVAGITLDFNVSAVQLFFSDTSPLGHYTISAYDSSGVLLEYFTVFSSETLPPGYGGSLFPPPGTTPLPGIYIGFIRPQKDIAKIKVGRGYVFGDAFAIDDVLFVADIEAIVDIKPGSCPNPFNPKNKGSVPVAIVGTEDLDGEDLAAMIDPTEIGLLIGDADPIWALDMYEIVDSTEPSDSEPFECADCFDAEANLNCHHWKAWTDDEPPRPIDPHIPGEDGISDSYCGDGIPDYVVKFDAQAIADAIKALDPEPVRDDCIEVVLIGSTLDGRDISGADSIVYKSKK